MSHSIWNVLMSELRKLFTLRSTVTAAAATVVAAGALGYLSGTTGARVLETGGSPGIVTSDPTLSGLGALTLVQIASVVFGALAGASEYRDGQVRVSLSAVPGRTLLLLAKTTVLVIVSAALSLVTVLVSCLSAEIGLGPYGVNAWATLSLVSGATAYLTYMTVLSFLVGQLARTAIVPMILLIALTQAGSNVLFQIDRVRDWARFLPDLAGYPLFLSPPSASAALPFLSAPQGGLVMAAWLAVLLSLGLLLFKLRDA